jgi:hypothetical protein
MVTAHHFFADRQRPPDQRLGFSIAALDFRHLTEIVRKRRDRGMLRACRLLVDRQRPSEQRLGIAVAAELLVMRRQIVQRLPDIRMT